MAQHTPGEWKAVRLATPNSDQTAFRIEGEERESGNAIAEIPSGPNGEVSQCIAADARLIEAAPKLLAAAEAAVRCLSGCGSNARDRRALAVLQPAIARARGEE